MFYDLIQRKCDAFYAAADCPMRSMIAYMEQRGELRDAQIAAIKTYLFLKVAGGNRPLCDLFCEGFFNSLDLDCLPLPVPVRTYLRENPAAAALYEFAAMEEDGKLRAPGIVAALTTDPAAIDAHAVLHTIFGGRSYAEYLFGLPMGAGKTFLMAAFIYLDLYFAMTEPKNPAFAHNFVILVPSGLKSSVVPSLRTIQRFDPTWVLAEPAASQVRRLLKFEMLDAGKSQKNSTRAKNPNVQKIALHQADPDLIGLVAVTNAEKVILDRVTMADGRIALFEDTPDERERLANELRSRIGRLPGLAVFIDEAHHAADDDIKLRAVVTGWSTRADSSVRGVIGFSGTPYLTKPQKIELTENLTFKVEEIPTIACSYRLVDGIGNFLKRPTVLCAEQGMESRTIMQTGLREFLTRYRDTRYADGTCAKLAIFFSNIESLEESYGEVAAIVEEAGLPSAESILKFHRGNKSYKTAEGAQLAFDTLDLPISRVRIVMLAEIGKEGWDCRSLTGVILAQKGACPLNKVLQTSCRCLRQITKGAPETALIYLNESNAKLLEKQLAKEHRTTVAEFEHGGGIPVEKRERVNRIAHLGLPPVSFVQMRVELTQEYSCVKKDIAAEIRRALTPDTVRTETFTERDLFGMVQETRLFESGVDLRAGAVFSLWLQQIAKESFGTLSLSDLRTYEEPLREIFAKITEEHEGLRFYRRSIVQSRVRTNIRRAFAEEWHTKVEIEEIPAEAHLLVADFPRTILTREPEKYYPSAQAQENILADDRGEFEVPQDVKAAIQTMERVGMAAEAEKLRRQSGLPEGKERSFHYLPYHMDSTFERCFLQALLPERLLAERNIEAYYNGDRSLTEFRIRCYEQRGAADWRYVGRYTPDFLLIERTEGRIARALIIETKGEIYAHDPRFQKRRKFMETKFRELNPNFDYLYLEDTMSDAERMQQTRARIMAFFT